MAASTGCGNGGERAGYGCDVERTGAAAPSAGYGDDSERVGCGRDCGGERRGVRLLLQRARAAAAASMGGFGAASGCGGEPGASCRCFFIFLKNLCRVSLLALGKVFAECPTNDTRQRPPLPTPECRVLFAVCGTRQSFCVYI